jgi:general secretion pathway protein A
MEGESGAEELSLEKSVLIVLYICYRMKRARRFEPGGESSFRSDYISRFGLTARPFSLTPDPAFYFPSTSHRTAVEQLACFVSRKEPLAIVFGEAGTGKTVLSRYFLASLDKERFRTGLIVNPIIEEREGFAEAILQSLGGDCTLGEGDSIRQLRQEVRDDRVNGNGRQTVLVIDEAQLLSESMLHFLTELAYPESVVHAPIQVVLFAQTDMITRLLEPRLERVRRAIRRTQCLHPLTAAEVGVYVEHRLSVAGSKGSIRFTQDATRFLGAHSEGYPRIINNLCDQCLFLLSSRPTNVVDRSLVKRILRDFGS